MFHNQNHAKLMKAFFKEFLWPNNVPLYYYISYRCSILQSFRPKPLQVLNYLCCPFLAFFLMYIPLRRPKVAILKWPIPLADSSELAIFRRIGHFSGESAIS